MTIDDAPAWPADREALLPAIVQDAHSRVVRMLGWMNVEAYDRTVETGRVTFWSRSRGALWTKGETSGNTLDAVALAWDCDRDALLVTARASGPTCHTGAETCWGEIDERVASLGGILDALARTIADRDARRPEGSYTVRLLEAGASKPAAKVVEEAGEVAVAATSEGEDRVAEEAADLVYHLLVLLRASGVDPDEVGARLAERARPAKPDRSG
ncbi:MAG: bifunctional phosphoribosyl-AMP cyclohydrolase/phosphoribosyl-ATP diphosphatase HisIE [Gemmatimonadota bacterium]|nr:bifunctional phosphoribosyl-AMP cyclohydrolase/phosphoribosyl-ATP diphosphatase HisIE [Gemmatimonadota bacterium]